MEDMAKIQKLARQAMKTFKTTGGSPSKQNLDILKSMIESITAADVNLNDPSKDRRRNLPGAPPVSHVNIVECQNFSMAVFIVNKGMSLPLHDHPGMFGLCKVLYGSIQVKMYDRHNSEEPQERNHVLSSMDSGGSKPQKFIYRGESVFDSKNGVCMVTPLYGNYHTIKAIGEHAAFLDILAPPYDGEKGRDCIYYKECNPQPEVLNGEDNKSNVRYLEQIPCPPEFFCDSLRYRGPSIKLDELIEACDEE